MLNIVTVFAAIIYLFRIVAWMHTPLVSALLLTLATALRFFGGLAWILQQLRRSPYLIQAKGSDGQVG